MVATVGDFVVEGVLLEASISHLPLYYLVQMKGTYIVGAGPAFQPRRQSNSTREEENGVECVQGDHDQWVTRPVEIDRRRDEVK